LEVLRCFINLLISAAEIYDVGKKSDVKEWEDVMVREVLFKMDLKWLAKASAMFLESVTISSQTSSQIEQFSFVLKLETYFQKWL
jgi:hypothetical protein